MFNTTALWRMLAPVWNAPGEGEGGASATPPAEGEGAPAGEGEGSPVGEGEGAQSGESSTPGNLITDGDKPNGGEGSGEGGDEFTPLTVESISENITLPEGVELAEEPMADFLGIMNNQELSRGEMAQKLVELQVGMAQEAADAASNAGAKLWDDTQAQWQQQARDLPEIGGEQLPQTLATIKKGLEHVGADQETFDALNITGAGNHPAIIKVMFELTKGLVETPPVLGDAAGEGRKLTPAEIMFGGNSSKE